MAKRIGWFIVVTMALVGALAYSGVNRADEGHDQAKRLLEAGEIMPLEQILERANRDQPGKVLESELEREDGRHVYELEVLDTGGVSHKLFYDAKTGERLTGKQSD